MKTDKTLNDKIDIFLNCWDYTAIIEEYVLNAQMFPTLPKKFEIFPVEIQKCILIMGTLEYWKTSKTPKEQLTILNRSLSLEILATITELPKSTIKKYLEILMSRNIIHQFTTDYFTPGEIRYMVTDKTEYKQLPIVFQWDSNYYQ